MITETATRHCLSCSKPLRGRSDKKFCDDYCRNSHNNKTNAEHNTYIRRVNNLLRRNRKILEELHVPGERTRVTKEALIQLGFHFKYATHRETGSRGQACLFCYDYGYADLGNDRFIVLKRKGKPLLRTCNS
jgi:predicted nucleic acid-binding Zn ribbon protein